MISLAFCKFYEFLFEYQERSEASIYDSSKLCWEYLQREGKYLRQKQIDKCCGV